MRLIPVSINNLRNSVERLNNYILNHHWNGDVAAGPDSGVRWNFKIGRFVKSYLNFIPWSDDYIFLQTQGYWILANWLMVDLIDIERCKDVALACSDSVVSMQRPDGYWEYPPISTRKGRIATVEGNIATIALAESYRRTRLEYILSAAKKWHSYLIHKVGFQENGDLAAIHYWAGISGGMVPNNTTLTLWTLAELADATGNSAYLKPCDKMVAFLRQVQMESGEIPYDVGDSKDNARTHFLCFQYNAFEFLDLLSYYRLTQDQKILPILHKLAGFLSIGVSESGSARYNCFGERPKVPYYTAALAAALSQATVFGLNDFRSLADRAYGWVLAQQRAEGRIQFFSQGDYGLLTDRRSYPRNLSMILYHLLLELRRHIHAAGKIESDDHFESAE